MTLHSTTGPRLGHGDLILLITTVVPTDATATNSGHPPSQMTRPQYLPFLSLQYNI